MPATTENNCCPALVPAWPSQPFVFLVSHSSAGGAQEIWTDIAEGFRANGRKADLVALYPGTDAVDRSAWYHVVAKRPSGLLAQIRMMWALAKLFRTRSPAMVLTAMPAANVLAPIAAILSGRRIGVVISHHSPATTHNPVLNAIDGWFGSLPSVRAVVGVSRTVAASLDDKPGVYRSKRRIIHNALPPAVELHLDSLARKRSMKAGVTRSVVAIGRLSPEKNLALLIRAAAQMGDVMVQLVGAGPEEERLKKLATELGVADRIVFLGRLPREDALAILADGGVFAQISLFEGHSLALIEAAKLGIPLIVSNVPAQIEGISAADGTRCGIVVETDAVSGLAREVVSLLDDPARHAFWASRARLLAAGSHYDAMIAEYLDLVS